MSLHAYLAQDRRRSLAEGSDLPVACHGAVLFSDVTGFTRLTEALAHGNGPRRGADELARRLNAVHQALIDEVERCGGSVVAFAGDGMTCWFDGSGHGAGAAAPQAARAARAMQRTMKAFPELGIRIGVAAGPALRVAAGDPAIQHIDLLAGATVARALRAETLADPGEVMLDAATAAALPAGEVGPVRDGADGEAFHPHLFGASELPAVDRPAEPSAPDDVPLPGADALRPWVLPFVFERETASGGLFATGLRPATALFLRLALGTGEPDGDGRAQAQALVDAVAQAQRALQQHGGVLLEASLDAEGLSLYGNFGAAQVHEDDPARALRAALALRSAFEVAGIPARFGVASGTLCVGGYGGASRRSFGAIGNEVNSAARLMAQAQPNEILVSGRVRQLAALDDEVEFEARAPVPLKGKAEPMAAFAALQAPPRRAIRLQEPAGRLPMVGRAAEQAALAGALARAQAGRRQVLRVVAEAGMGKSRLLAEGIRLARRAGFQCYGGACRTDGVRTPYRLWQGVWTAFFDHDPALPQRRQAQALQAVLRLQAPEHAEAWPLLGSVLGADWADTPFTAALQPKDRKALLEALLLRCLQSAAEEAAEDGVGLLLVLEDLHAADPLSLDLLGVLVRGSAGWPLWLLTSERPGDDAAHDASHDAAAPAAAALWDQAGDDLTTLGLDGLDAADVAQMVRAKLALHFPERADAVPAALLDRVAGRAQGNPFFVEQLIDSLHDRGIDPRRPEALAALELPGTLHSAVLSRLDRLGEARQNLLKAASVIGREFTLDDLVGYCPTLGPRAQVAAELAALHRLGFAPVLPGTGGARHVFAHGVTLEACYESIAVDTRARLHAQYAHHLMRPLARLPADAREATELAPLLAHHLGRAGLRAEAAAQHRLAAAGAIARFANDEALAHLQAALDGALADDLAGRFALLAQRQAILDLQGRHAARQQDIDALARLAPLLPDAVLRQAQVATLRAALAIGLGDLAAARASAQSALDGVAGAGHSAATLRAEALLLQAQAMLRGGDPVAARPVLEAALAEAQEHGLPNALVTALTRLGHLHWHTGDLAEAERWLGLALARAGELADLRAQLDILNILGVVAKAGRHLADAVARYEEALQIARRIGDTPGEAMLLNNLGSACLENGNFHEAGRHCAQAEAMFAAAGDVASRGLALGNCADAHRELGQTALAIRLSGEALALLRASGFRPAEAAVLENLGLAEADAGHLDAARARLREAADLAHEIDWPAGEARARMHLGRLDALADLAALDAAPAAASTRVDGQEGRAEGTAADNDDSADSADLAPLDAAERIAAPLHNALLGLEIDAAQALALLVRRRTVAARARIDGPLQRLLAAPASDTLPLRLHAAALRVLAAAGDPALPALRERARRELVERAARIPDAAARRDFFDLPDHRALLAG